MRDLILNPISDKVRRWYIPLISGIIFIATGIAALVFPKASFFSLVIFFSISFLFIGISEIIFSVSNYKTLKNWGWHLILGTITVLMGIMLIKDPGFSAGVLALYVGLTFLFRSIATITLSIDLKNYDVKNWGFMLALGILGSIASIILIANPVLAGISLVALVSFGFITLGTFHVYFAIQLNKVRKFVKKNFSRN